MVGFSICMLKTAKPKNLFYVTHAHWQACLLVRIYLQKEQYYLLKPVCL